MTSSDAEADSDNHQQIMFQWELHKIRAEGAYQSLREDTALSNDDIEMLTFDLQQVLSTPLLTTNVVFYKRQLSTYNLGINDCKTDQEGVASRGSGEIGSCLLHHLREKATTATKLVLYSDSCEPKHKFTLSMALILIYLSLKLIRNLW